MGTFQADLAGGGESMSAEHGPLDGKAVRVQSRAAGVGKRHAAQIQRSANAGTIEANLVRGCEYGSAQVQIAW